MIHIQALYCQTLALKPWLSWQRIGGGLSTTCKTPNPPKNRLDFIYFVYSAQNMQCISGRYFFVLVFWTTHGSAQEPFLGQCSGVTPSGVHRTTDVGDQICIFSMQSMCSKFSAFSLSDFFLPVYNGIDTGIEQGKINNKLSSNLITIISKQCNHQLDPHTERFI